MPFSGIRDEVAPVLQVVGRRAMRWIKHMTATTQDERVAAYLEDCGPAHRHEGYGFFWMLLEVVSAQIESGTDKCSATYPLPTWSRLLYCHHHTVGKYLGKLEVTGMVTVRKGEGKIEVIIPNLLKYRDEYSRKSGVSQESVRSKKQIQRQNTDTEIDIPKPTAPGGACLPELPPPVKAVLPIIRPPRKGKRTTDQIRTALGPERMVWWENFWRVYPCHDGMNEGMDAFERRVTDHDLAVVIWKGAKAYAAKCAADPTVKVKFAQGWINSERWTDENVIPAPVPNGKKKDFVENVTAVIQRNMEQKGTPW